MHCLKHSKIYFMFHPYTAPPVKLLSLDFQFADLYLRNVLGHLNLAIQKLNWPFYYIVICSTQILLFDAYFDPDWACCSYEKIKRERKKERKKERKYLLRMELKQIKKLKERETQREGERERPCKDGSLSVPIIYWTFPTFSVWRKDYKFLVPWLLHTCLVNAMIWGSFTMKWS